MFDILWIRLEAAPKVVDSNRNKIGLISKWDWLWLNVSTRPVEISCARVNAFETSIYEHHVALVRRQPLDDSARNEFASIIFTRENFPSWTSNIHVKDEDIRRYYINCLCVVVVSSINNQMKSLVYVCGATSMITTRRWQGRQRFPGPVIKNWLMGGRRYIAQRLLLTRQPRVQIQTSPQFFQWKNYWCYWGKSTTLVRGMQAVAWNCWMNFWLVTSQFYKKNANCSFITKSKSRNSWSKTKQSITHCWIQTVKRRTTASAGN